MEGEKGCSRQHLFSNEFAGMGAEKPHFFLFDQFHISGKCMWNCSENCLRVSLYLLHAFTQWEGNSAALYTCCCMGFAAEVSLVVSPDSKQPASRWCCALLGIFSLDNLTFEQLSRASVLRSVCQLLSAKLSPFICRYLATVCKWR